MRAASTSGRSSLSRQRRGVDASGRHQALLAKKRDVIDQSINVDDDMLVHSGDVDGEVVMSDRQKKEKATHDERKAAEKKVNKLRAHFYSQDSVQNKRPVGHRGNQTREKGGQKPHIYSGPPHDRPAGLY